MQTLASAGDWSRHWLYDWGGANVDLFLSINRAVPDAWLWLAESLTWLGSYWGAPAVAATLLLWSRSLSSGEAMRVKMALSRFVVGLLLALSVGAAAKAAFAFPRPSTALEETAFRVVGTPDSLYTLPSGHATYVAVLVAAVWPLFGWPARVALLTFMASVGWSRVALGAHFPADVLAGFALGWACFLAANPLARWVDGRFSVSGHRQ
jgi:membrane-associated phospholipid phosphatase